ncbi:uncharacterized protein PGTG_20241 [Puccinia graminis f. sp. tritici CRL 75-36-700-3]|uniref:Uncharacterized protein n=1 Tax=Puccinia graminis f. sp. tritici (strain CRL 75-36-700-3 / race SCCL) TaxID=418459 RepID=E3NXJ4_PUCGT|nr:uncharacterized protein PGTG_20241 [Puccinia graminis f. sp. tritici CRL 75-36-700-3]EFP94293.1 hypothetical protein PGTG_20241 [Puccinia graminis f. sp. tritici CRL 75-36-700-3]
MNMHSTKKRRSINRCDSGATNKGDRFRLFQVPEVSQSSATLLQHPPSPSNQPKHFHIRTQASFRQSLDDLSLDRHPGNLELVEPIRLFVQPTHLKPNRPAPPRHASHHLQLREKKELKSRSSSDLLSRKDNRDRH